MPTKQLDEEALFHAARRIAAGEARELFLAQACGGDAGLAERVRALLEMHEQEPESATPEPVRTLDYEPIAERPGSRIGPYRLMEQIGEGGFGLVFVAEQQEPVRRKVALKVIKPGMDTRQVIARFEAERQALALMDHPNIARVLDAGATPPSPPSQGGARGGGRPYFVMELVRGIPITEYCDKNQLAPKERLELFVTVCQAVQHAHQKGIIHRDIKPSNVLVTSHDGKPVPKIIDFGVAKAISQHLTERTIYTQFAQMIGTPLYMSPEQAEMSGLDIDTRSDIYSLGVLLYELLTGTTPLEKKRFAQAAYDEIRKMIREEEPPRPSTRLSQSGDSLPSIAAQRHTEPAKLSKLVRGDLDWITMKCLEKDRTRRYETANGLARDIERHLADEPVEACPPSATYRLRKLAKKHKAGLATAAAIAALLVAGITVSTWQAVRATQAQRAVLAERDAKEQARCDAEANAAEAKRQQAAALEQKQKADKQAAIAKAVTDFLLKDLLAQANVASQMKAFRSDTNDGWRPDFDIKVRTLVDRAAKSLEGKFHDQPLTEAAIRMTIGETYFSLWQHANAQTHLERAVVLRKANLGPDHADTMASMSSLAQLYWSQQKHDLATRLYEEVVQRQTANLGAEHPDTLRTKSQLADVYRGQKRYDAAERLSQEVLKAHLLQLGLHDLTTLVSQNRLGGVYLQQGKYDLAQPLLRAAVEGIRTNREWYKWYGVQFIYSLTACYERMELRARAERLYREQADYWKKENGPDSQMYASQLIQLGKNLLQQNKFPAAESVLRDTLAIHEKTLKLGWETYGIMSQLGEALLGQKKYADAEPLLRASYEGMISPATGIPVGGRPRITETLERLVRLYDAWGKPDEAAKWRGTLGTARYRAGDWKGAIADLEQAISLRKPDDPTNASEGFFLAMAHWQLGEKDKSRAWFDKAVQWMEKGKKDDAELKRFHAEAAELLGVEKKD